jgi:hypothetical protein
MKGHTMSEKNTDAGARVETLDQRIINAPLISREDLLNAVFGPESDPDAPPHIKEALRRALPRAEEWIDSPEGEPYVSETAVPIYTPNGDGSGGEEIFGDPAMILTWMDKHLAGIPRVGDSAGSDAERAEPTQRDTE